MRSCSASLFLHMQKNGFLLTWLINATYCFDLFYPTVTDIVVVPTVTMWLSYYDIVVYPTMSLWFFLQ